MSRETNDFITWFYRGIIFISLTVIFSFVKMNYDDFREMKADIYAVKIDNYAQKETNKVTEMRLVKLEQWAK